VDAVFEPQEGSYLRLATEISPRKTECFDPVVAKCLLFQCAVSNLFVLHQNRPPAGPREGKPLGVRDPLAGKLTVVLRHSDYVPARIPESPRELLAPEVAVNEETRRQPSDSLG